MILNQIKELAPESKVLSELYIEWDSVDDSDGQIEKLVTKYWIK